MKPVRIRCATVEDAPVIHRLLKDLAAALGKSSDIRSSAADIARYGFGDGPRFKTLLAFEGDEPVGLAVFFYEFSTWMGTPGVYVQDLYVSPRMRGRGVGRDLVDAVRDRAAEWDGRYVKLAVYDGNEQALGFYQALGFRICHDEQVLALKEQ
jgi:ribosomal protein S18 acetylase RimI-like enzyme